MKSIQKGNKKRSGNLIFNKNKKHHLLVQLLNLILNHKFKSDSKKIQKAKNKSILNNISKNGLK